MKTLTVTTALLTCFAVTSFAQDTTKTRQTKRKSFFDDNKHFMSLAYVGNIPNAPLGAGFWYYNNKSRFAFYFDVKSGSKKSGTARGDELYENIDVAQANAWGDKMVKKENYIDKSTLLFDFGVGISLTKSLLAYGGLGYASHNDIDAGYLQYYDNTKILGDNGYYWIRDYKKDNSKNSINLNAGILYKNTNGFIGFVGFDTFPLGANVGIGFSF